MDGHIIKRVLVKIHKTSYENKTSGYSKEDEENPRRLQLRTMTSQNGRVLRMRVPSPGKDTPTGNPIPNGKPYRYKYDYRYTD